MSQFAQLYLPTTESLSTPRNTVGKTLISCSDKFCILRPSLNQWPIVEAMFPTPKFYRGMIKRGRTDLDNLLKLAIKQVLPTSVRLTFGAGWFLLEGGRVKQDV